MDISPTRHPRRLVLRTGITALGSAAGVVALGGAAGVASGLVNPTIAAAAPRTFFVIAGADSGNHATELVANMPREITINAGDTVEWSVQSMAPHTITFVKGEPWPGVGDDIIPSGASYDGTTAGGSPLLFKGQGYTLTFTQPGDYPYVCLIHSAPANNVMRGVVHVQPADTPRPAQNGSPHWPAKEAMHALLQKGDTMALFAQREAAKHPGTVYIGVDDATDVVMLRFYPGNLTIKRGQTVHFELLGYPLGTAAAAPHTVTFGEFAGDPFSAPPSGDPTNYQGGNLHSGLLWTAIPGQPTAFDVTFTKAGVYPYVCVIHEDAHMEGFINVTPA